MHVLQVTAQEALAFATKNGLAFFETAAVSAHALEKARGP